MFAQKQNIFGVGGDQHEAKTRGIVGGNERKISGEPQDEDLFVQSNRGCTFAERFYPAARTTEEGSGEVVFKVSVFIISILFNLTIFASFRHPQPETKDQDSVVFQEFQRQLDQVQMARCAGPSKKIAEPRINDTENELLKDNRKLVAESEDLRKKLKKSEERVRNMEKLFRDSNKKLTPNEVKALIKNASINKSV